MAYYFAIQLMMNAVGRVSLSEKANTVVYILVLEK